jgi:hypothetical protein
MSGLLGRLARTETIEALVMGTLAAQARRRRAALGPLPAVAHPIADLTGQPIPVIAEAVLAATLAAHLGDDPNQWPCASCDALLDLASHYGDPTDKVWPDPVRRYLADAIDAELAQRKEQARWPDGRRWVTRCAFWRRSASHLRRITGRVV